MRRQPRRCPQFAAIFAPPREPHRLGVFGSSRGQGIRPPPVRGKVGRDCMTTMRTALADSAARFAFSETARLDAELLMAHALDDRRGKRLLLGHLDRSRPARPSRRWSRVAWRTNRSPISPAARAFWTIDLSCRPRRADPAPRQRNADRSRHRRISRAARRTTILDLGTGPGTPVAGRRSTEWPDAHGLGVDRVGHRRWTMRCRNAAAISTWRTGPRFVAWRLGGGHSTGAIRPRSSANPPYIGTDEVHCPKRFGRSSRAAALFAGAGRAGRLSRPRRPAAAADRAGRLRGGGDRPSPGGGGGCAVLRARARQRRASRSGRARPLPARDRAATGLKEAARILIFHL